METLQDDKGKVGPTPDEILHVASLEDLYGQLGQLSMVAGWNRSKPSLWPEPRKNFLPAHWRYVQAKAALDAAGRLVDTERAERRNLNLVNPLEGNTHAIARTMVAAYQMLGPSERARTHRHVPNALRLIIDAEPGIYSVVDGVKLPMTPGDVVLTPNWCWHGHGNDGSFRAYWLDVLDVPLVQLLEPMFSDSYPGGFENGLAPTQDSPWVFKQQEIRRRLDEASPDGRHGIQVELGHPALDTIALFMMRLPAGSSSTPYKTTANTIYAVVEGEGVTIVEGQRFAWSRGDVMVVPAWCKHCHHTEQGGVLFRVTDEPTMSKLGFLRIQAE